MTKKKVIIVASTILLLGVLQFAHWYGSKEKAAGLGRASAMIAMLSGAAIALYGSQMKERK